MKTVAENIILFDGMCNFCDASVQFIIRRDKQGMFKFASLQGEKGTTLRNKFALPDDLDSFILVAGDKVHVKSSAALHVARRLRGLWKFLYIFMIVPRSIRDAVYDFVAKNRYKWFGKKESCMLPSPEIRERFYD